jgi:antitoxin component YwqK of YwqJK toxin-antitoxin module
MWILAFWNAKYEGKEFEKKYSFTKFFLIALWISLLYGLWDARKQYYYQEGIYMLESFNLTWITETTIVEKDKCYREDWKLNTNPDKDKEWNIVNCYNDKGQQHWKWLWYNWNWIPIVEENYIDGVKNWMEIWTWHDNWKLRYEVNVIDWKREWEGRSYYQDWSLEFIENYKNGILDWTKEYYFKNGKIKRIETLENWKMVWASNYFEDNDIEEVEVFINWEKKGTAYNYPEGYFDE